MGKALQDSGTCFFRGYSLPLYNFSNGGGPDGLPLFVCPAIQGLRETCREVQITTNYHPGP